MILRNVCYFQYPGVYARVTKFLNWIKHNLGAPDRQLVEESQFDSSVEVPYEFEDSDDEYFDEEEDNEEEYDDDSFEYEEDGYGFDDNFEYVSEF